MSKAFVASLLIIISFNVNAQNNFHKAWEKLRKSSKFKDSEFSLELADLEGKVLFDVNGTEALIPASLTKIVTAAAVIDNFDLEKKWEVELFSKTKPKSEVLKENICFKGNGTPGFISEQLWVLANNFVRSDIKEIQGDLIIDNSDFDEVKFDSSRQKQRVSRAYDAPVSASSFNWNSINIYIRPSQLGNSAKVWLDPENNFTKVQNKVATSTSPTNIKIERNSSELGDTFIIKGKINKNENEKVFFRSITQPEIWTGEQIKSFLSRRNILIKGKVKLGSCKDYSHLLASAESRNISRALKDMMKFSNNFVAEMLVKNIAKSKKPNEAASLSAGLKYVDEYLKPITNKKNYHIESVSGFSRKNKMSSNLINSVLRRQYLDFGKSFEFISSFPVSGVDGTLKKRLNSPITKGRVRAKTGLLNNVVGLAGYLRLESGRVLTFSFIYNGKGNKEWKVRELFDDYLEAIMRG